MSPRWILAAGAAALFLAGILLLRWALGWEQAVELVAGLIGTGLCWLAGVVLLGILWAARRSVPARPQDLTWSVLKKRLDPYYGLFSPHHEEEDDEGGGPGPVSSFFRRHLGLEPSPFLTWLLPLYLFIRMAEACADEGDWSHFLDLSKELTDQICERLALIDCFEEGRKLQYLHALGPEGGASQCPWFGERLPVLRAALVSYVRAHFDEYSGGDRS